MKPENRGLSPINRIIPRSGSFTRADGSEGEAGNFLLAVNYFERAFAPVVVSEVARALPDFKGSGWVRDLREAATLEPGLIDLVAQADHAPTRAGYKAAIGDLIKAWALASDYARENRGLSPVWWSIERGVVLSSCVVLEGVY
jgi:hypothetical protein